jgi:N-acetylmuramoyl-L-alanine amidase
MTTKIRSPNQSSRKGKKPLMVVIHGTGSLNEEGTISWLSSSESKVSYHYMIGRDGEVVQFVEEDARAWHAGKSHWAPLGFSHTSVNSWSIGIGLVNDGSAPYPRVQYRVCAELVADITLRHAIGLHLVRGHNEVSPGRKIDPYDVWDWRYFYGLYGMAAAGRLEALHA